MLTIFWLRSPSQLSLCVFACLMLWFGCPAKCSFQSGYFGPQLDSLAVCLHPVVNPPLQQLPVSVCVCVHVYICVCTTLLRRNQYCTFHSELTVLYVLSVLSGRKLTVCQRSSTKSQTSSLCSGTHHRAGFILTLSPNNWSQLCLSVSKTSHKPLNGF